MNLLCRKILNELCRYSTLKGTVHHILFLKCQLWIGLPSKQCRMEKGRKSVNLQGRNLTNTPSAGWVRSTSMVTNHVDSMALDMMWWKGHFTSVIFLTKTYNPSVIIRKAPEKLQLRGFLKYTWLVLLKIFEVFKNMESLRKCHI